MSAVHNPRMRYFAYGSNMNPARLSALGVRCAARRAARLPGWRLVFRKRASDTSGCAYATIERAPDGCVEGVLYTLADRDGLLRLDAFEDAPRLYRRQTMKVAAIDGTTTRSLFAEAYIAQPSVCADGLAIEDWYLAHLLAAADLLSPAYVAALRALPVVNTKPRW